MFAVLVDTSIWIDVLRDKTRYRWGVFKQLIGDLDRIALCRFTQLELLQGAKDEHEWAKLDAILETQTYLEMPSSEYQNAARLYFRARRSGKTARSAIDGCIAQIAMYYRVPLLHRDRDFQALASISELSEVYLDWNAPARTLKI